MVPNNQSAGQLTIGQNSSTTVTGFVNFTNNSSGGINVGVGAQLTINGGFNVSQLNASGNVVFDDQSQVIVTNGGINVFSSGAVRVGPGGAGAGAPLTKFSASSAFQVVSLQALAGVTIGTGTQLTSGGSLNLFGHGIKIPRGL